MLCIKETMCHSEDPTQSNNLEKIYVCVCVCALGVLSRSVVSD